MGKDSRRYRVTERGREVKTRVEGRWEPGGTSGKGDGTTTACETWSRKVPGKGGGNVESKGPKRYVTGTGVSEEGFEGPR